MIVSLLQIGLRFKVAEAKVISCSIVGFDLFGADTYSHCFTMFGFVIFNFSKLTTTTTTTIIIIIIIIKNNIIIIIRTFPACVAPENFSMLNNLVNLWPRRTAVPCVIYNCVKVTPHINVRVMTSLVM